MDEKKVEGKKWTDFGLDEKILYAIKKNLRFSEPTGIQQSVITEALNGKDILAKSATGTGKTAAVLIPTIQKILHSNENETSAIYLVPSNELGEQINEHFKKLSTYAESVTSLHLTDAMEKKERKKRLKEKPKMIITTPSLLLSILDKKELSLETIETVILDEADFLLSEGNIASINKLHSKHLKKVIFQCIMISATLDEKLRKSFLFHDPIIIQDGAKPEVYQYYLNCKDLCGDGIFVEKMIKLHFLIQFVFRGGRVLIFVENSKTAYTLLINFNELLVDGVVVLNDSYPLLSRSDIIEKFNTGKIRDPEMMKSNKKHKNKTIKKMEESEEFEHFNISRGIDFNQVAAVINFDVPPTLDEYIHRIGRTARSTQIGVAITFLSDVTIEEEAEEEDVEEEEVKKETFEKKKKIEEAKKKKKKSETVWKSILDHCAEKNIEIKEYELKDDGMENFRYRIVGTNQNIGQKVKTIKLSSISKEIKNAIRIKNKWDAKKTMKHDFLQKSDELIPNYLKPIHEQTDEKLENAGLLKKSKRRIEDDIDERNDGNVKKKKKKIDPLKKLFF